MTATNRPIDLLLNMDSPSINLAQRRNSGASNSSSSELSALNRRENSFEKVYRQQRRDDTEVRQPARTEARSEARASQTQTSAPATTVNKDNKASKDGKPLPQASIDSREKETEAVAHSSESERVTDHDASQSLVEYAAEHGIEGGDEVSNLMPIVDAELDTAQADDTGMLTGEAANSNVALPDEQTTATELEMAEVEQVIPDEDDVLVPPVVTEARQTQGVASTTAVDANARAAQLTGASADVAATLTQSRLDEAIKHADKADINAPGASKTSVSAGELASQQPVDRLAQLTSAMDFNLLREQLAAGTVKLDSAAASLAKGGALDAINANDAATDRQPRLNSLSPLSPASLQAKPGVVSAAVQQPLGSAEWGQALSQRIVWLANRGISAAELQLNPRDLGPVDVRINVNGEQTTVQFSSQHAAVREALESSVVRLREMMESSGLNLADVDVSDQSQSEQAQADAGDDSARGSAEESDELDSAAETRVTQQLESDGLVDFYA